jgi:biopolymer transport protein ExbB
MCKRNLMSFIIILLVLVGVCALCFDGFAQADKVQPYVSALEESKEGMSLWATIKGGGFIMVVLALLSILAVTIIVYNFMMLKLEQLAPKNFSEKAIKKLEEHNIPSTKKYCNQNDNVISRIILSGLEKKKRGALFTKEAMENTAKKEIGKLWQNISYLSDIATIAPLIGLLGTVLGMIQAFNVIAFDTAVVKPILLAGGVSKAMVTTAGGLFVAIPVMLFYSFFRARVQDISDVIETYSTDIIKIIEDLGDQ